MVVRRELLFQNVKVHVLRNHYDVLLDVPELPAHVQVLSDSTLISQVNHRTSVVVRDLFVVPECLFYFPLVPLSPLKTDLGLQFMRVLN